MMQLYRVDVEISRSGTVMVWAHDEGEAEEIARDDARDWDDDDAYVSTSIVDALENIPTDWLEDEPLNCDDGLTCRELLTTGRLDLLLEKPIIDPRQLQLGERPNRTAADETDRVCLEYTRLLTKLHQNDYDPEDLDRCYELSKDPRVRRRLTERQWTATRQREESK